MKYVAGPLKFDPGCRRKLRKLLGAKLPALEELSKAFPNCRRRSWSERSARRIRIERARPAVPAARSPASTRSRPLPRAPLLAGLTPDVHGHIRERRRQAPGPAIL